MSAFRRFFGFVSLALAVAAVPISCRADEAGSDPSAHAPVLPPAPPLPSERFFGQDGDAFPSSRNLPAPDAGLYHEYGTVTPGGGAPRGNRLPDYGGLVIGPGGVIKPPPPRPQQPPAPKPLTPEQRQARIRKALIPPPPASVLRRRTLDDLYGKLAAATDADEAKSIASLIETVWSHSGSDTANLLMTRADQAIAKHDFPLALRVLDKVVDLQPGWAEAWNRRATARFLAGDLNGAMADVGHVLTLDPKHFGALNGMAMILQRTGFDKRALQVYRRELAIYPHQPQIEQLIEQLSTEVEGQGI